MKQKSTKTKVVRTPKKGASGRKVTAKREKHLIEKNVKKKPASKKPASE